MRAIPILLEFLIEVLLFEALSIYFYIVLQLYLKACGEVLDNSSKIIVFLGLNYDVGWKVISRLEKNWKLLSGSFT